MYKIEITQKYIDMKKDYPLLQRLYSDEFFNYETDFW